MASRFAALVGINLVVLLHACSKDGDSGTGASDAAAGAETGSDASIDRSSTDVDAPDAGGAVDSGPKPIRCTQAQFDAPCSVGGGDCTGPTNTQIDIAFPMGLNPQQYTNNCVKVRVGTVIDFAGSFVQHPLEPFGGDTPNPIPKQSTNPPVGSSGMPELLVTMSTAGTFGFQCEFHAMTMFGAIQVVP